MPYSRLELSIICADAYREDDQQKGQGPRFNVLPDEIATPAALFVSAFEGSIASGLSGFDHPTDGFFARTYTHGNDIVIAFRGTDDALDALADLTLGIGLINDQLRAAYHYVKFVAETLQIPLAEVSSRISFTGHSLGGALAAAMARYWGGSATVFNPAPYASSAASLAAGVAADDDWEFR